LLHRVMTRLARRVHSRQRSSPVALGAKRTLTETDLQNRICEGTLSSLEVSPPPERPAARTGCVFFLFSCCSVLLFVARREAHSRYVEPRFLCSSVACGESIGGGLYPASCFFPVIYREIQGKRQNRRSAVAQASGDCDLRQRGRPWPRTSPRQTAVSSAILPRNLAVCSRLRQATILAQVARRLKASPQRNG
jgi:hypothetical protein